MTPTLKLSSPMRALLQCPPAIRPLLASSSTLPTPTTPATSRRLYHSYETSPPPPYPPPESAILAAALPHIPTLGFTQAALQAGARDAGFLDASVNLFPRGEFELVLWHLRTQRLGLGARVQFPDVAAGAGAGVAEGQGQGQGREMGTGGKVRALVMERLRGNVEAGVLGRLQEAIALMSLAGNIPPSLRELYLLSDEIWFLAGDKTVDSSWYTKRASLSAIYAATEVYQTTDQSTDMRDTEAFLDRRLEAARTLGSALSNVGEWAGFQVTATVNLARNWGMRI